MSISGMAHGQATIAQGSYVGSSLGDAGSPWLVNDMLVGITSGEVLQQHALGHYVDMTYSVDLNSETSRSFLDATLE